MSTSNDERFELAGQGFRTGGWQVEPRRNLLVRQNEQVRVEPRVMDALVYLAERPGKVVSKDELVRFVWQGRCVTDDVLTVTISALRRALGDDARRPEYVETIPRRGYRWIAPVFRLGAGSGAFAATVTQVENTGPMPAPHRLYISRFAALGILFVALLASSVWIIFRATNRRHVSLPEAHEAYLKGRFFLDQRSIQGWRQALEEFRRATALDPEDSAPQAGLADTYSAMSDFGVASRAEMRPQAFQSANRALELDRKSAEGYEALGRAQFLFDWDFQAAERSLNKALSLNSDYMPTHQAMAWLKSAEGKYTEAAASAQMALQLDPVNTARYTELAWVLALGGRCDEAQHEIERALALNPRSVEAYLMKGWVSDLAGDSTAAFRAYYNGLRISGVPDEVLKRIENVYRAEGLPGYYRDWLEVQRRGGTMPMSSTFRAQLYVHAGEPVHALQSLEDAYEKREGALAWVNVEPSFHPLRSEPRFKAIAARVGQGIPTAR
jgi:DNA-binding winged helix-turn-helix (wHTH) protein/tetratricopeptide (TPR) repeat protein